MTAASRGTHGAGSRERKVRGGSGGRRWLAPSLCALLAAGPLLGESAAAGEGPSPDARAQAQQRQLAQAGARRFDIPAGALPSALQGFARQAGLELLDPAGLAAGRRSRGLAGRYAPERALQLLLAGSGLGFRFANGSTVVLESAGQGAADADAGAGAGAGGTLRLAPITVEGAGESAYGPVAGYKAARTATATRTDTPILDVPQSIQVVPRAVIEDQKADSLAEVVKNVSGVQAGGTLGNRSEALRIRGFETYYFATDGMPSNQFLGDEVFLDLANVERVEVLKGPASVLYGNNDPGGVVNLVTKQPLAEPYAAGELTLGSYDFFRPTLDLSTPLTEDGSLGFRVNAAYQRNDSFRDFFIDSERVFVAPVGRWQIDPDTRLTLSAQYSDQKTPFDRGLVASGDGVADLPASRYLGEDFSVYEADQERFGYLLEHDFNADWSLRSSARVVTGEALRVSADPRTLLADGRTLTRRARRQEDHMRELRAQNDLVGEFETGGVGHKLLLGLEAARADRDVNYVLASLASIDIFDPVYGAEPGDYGAATVQDHRVYLVGGYLQDQVSLGEQWQLVAGGRFDYADTREILNGAETVQTDSHFSPRLGLVYKPLETVSLYASYSQSFLPQVGSSFDGQPFDPETGEQYEVGVKSELLDRRLSVTLAAFQLTRRNVLTADPDNSGFSVQTGEQRSRGLELDVTGEILPGWRVMASGAWIDAVVTKDNEIPVGNRLNDVPEFSGSLWSTYELQEGELEGLGFGAGLFAAGNREGDLDNSFEIGGYVRADAAVYYRYNENLKAAINVENLFDADYIEAARSRTEIYPGAPLTVLGTLSLKF
ncbi:iron complex outermembrane recepter protein [Tistlia consotensis]|uniref:Iron complex outermembrane recepter protein n=1 Tax=Tistlia consotensis USBA 355 TaxID=560819 RepID=A0A1Y6CHY1_9PROT|nr:TonB-dependent siderophore receptor [Tistlia consotensis]SMF55854.1 iron complex outermembrane recepter protein [Tistlia consotensis USBA 355]SNR89431.1 iron complex outermembrane recepter protein [Tistlia consotensis]